MTTLKGGKKNDRSRRCFVHGISKENILKDVRPSDLYMVSLDTSAYIAAMCIKDFIFNKQFRNSLALDELSEGIAVYRKNNQPEAEFWRNMCRQIIYLNEEKEWL